MTNGGDVQRELQALLSAVDPSPAFAPGVRARVVAAGAPRSRGAAWAWALGGAVCLASFAWALMVRGPAVVSVPPAPVTSSAALAQPLRQATPMGPAAKSDGSRFGRRLRLRAAPSAPADVEWVSAEAGDPRVLVPDDQRIALVTLLQRLHQGRATVPAGVVPAYDRDGLLVPPEPLVIVPLPDPASLDPDDKGATADPKGPVKDKQ
jgi:hypothetical protein